MTEVDAFANTKLLFECAITKFYQAIPDLDSPLINAEGLEAKRKRALLCVELLESLGDKDGVEPIPEDGPHDWKSNLIPLREDLIQSQIEVARAARILFEKTDKLCQLKL